MALSLALRVQGLDLADCLASMAELHHTDFVALKRRFLGFRSGSRNGEFIDAVIRGAPRDMVFFHVENAVMKLLNDVVFRDKELSASVEALYTQRFLENLREAAKRDPRLTPRLFYSDFKSTRLGFEGSLRELEPLLREVHLKTARDFVEALREFPALQGLLRDATGIAQNPISWHMAGIGTTPEAASAGARYARYRFLRDQPTGEHLYPAVENFHSEAVQAEFNRGVTALSRSREIVQRRFERLFGEDTAALSLAEEGWQGKVLSREAIELIRRHIDEPDDAFVRHAGADFEARFGQIAPTRAAEFRQALLSARDYFRTADRFAPSIYERAEIFDMGVAGARHGVVSVDLAGQNVRNIHQLMISVARASHDALPEGMSRADFAVHLARQGQDRQSTEFEARRDRFRQAIVAAGLEGHGELRFSGDDGMFIPTAPLTEVQKGRLLAELARLGEPSDYRVAFLPSQFSGTNTTVPPRRRAALIGFGELVEKKLRLELERSNFPMARLRGILIAADVVPLADGQARINILISGRHEPADIETVSEAVRRLLPQGAQMGTVTAVPPPPSAPVPARNPSSERQSPDAYLSPRYFENYLFPSGVFS